MRVSLLAAVPVFVILLIWTQPGLAQPAENQLKPFTTDGCSVWIDGPPTSPYLWRHCCVAHDLAYWPGGLEAARLKADQELRGCIARLAGQAMANYMYFFVSTGGSPLWLTPYRWGYGWNYLDTNKPRGYRALTQDERNQLDALMPLAQQRVAEDAQAHPARASILRLVK